MREGASLPPLRIFELARPRARRPKSGDAFSISAIDSLWAESRTTGPTVPCPVRRRRRQARLDNRSSCRSSRSVDPCWHGPEPECPFRGPARRSLVKKPMRPELSSLCFFPEHVIGYLPPQHRHMLAHVRRSLKVVSIARRWSATSLTRHGEPPLDMVLRVSRRPFLTALARASASSAGDGARDLDRAARLIDRRRRRGRFLDRMPACLPLVTAAILRRPPGTVAASTLLSADSRRTDGRSASLLKFSGHFWARHAAVAAGMRAAAGAAGAAPLARAGSGARVAHL